MEFNNENIESILNDPRFTTAGLNNSLNHLQILTLEARKIVEEVMKENPEATHDEIVEKAVEIFEQRQAELEARDNSSNEKEENSERDED